MRFRNINLSTGRMLTYFDSLDRTINRSLLFLISGPEDIPTLTTIEEVCRTYTDSDNSNSSFEWFDIPDQRNLAWVDPSLDVGDIIQIEACEFTGLSQNVLRTILHTVLHRIKGGERELLPCAGGAAGGPAEGIHFLNREEDSAALTSLVSAGKSVLLLAPRRSGKTSLLLRLCKALEQSFSCHFVSLERYDAPEQIAARLRMFATNEGFRAALNEVQRSGGFCQEVLSEALGTLESQAGKPSLLMLDELVLFFQNLYTYSSSEAEVKKEISRLLNLLAKTLSELDVQVLIAGSLDLIDYLETEIGIGRDDMPGFFSMLEPFHLKPLSPEDSKIELMRILLGTGIVLEADDKDWLTENVDLSVPYPALNFLDRLASTLRARGKGLRGNELSLELDRFVANTDAFREFDSHIQGIQRKISNATRAVGDALTLLADVPLDKGVPIADVKQRLRDHLAQSEEVDMVFTWLCYIFPVRQEQDRLTLVSRLFRRWWQHQIK